MKHAVLTLAFVLTACGAERPAAIRAVAVGLGALGTGMATAAQTCASQSQDVCQTVSITSAIAVGGVALAAGAVAFLEHPAVAIAPAVVVAATAPQPQPDPVTVPDPMFIPSDPAPATVRPQP